jgi:hypothetical protein
MSEWYLHRNGKFKTGIYHCFGTLLQNRKTATINISERIFCFDQAVCVCVYVLQVNGTGTGNGKAILMLK